MTGGAPALDEKQQRHPERHLHGEHPGCAWGKGGDHPPLVMTCGGILRLFVVCCVCVCLGAVWWCVFLSPSVFGGTPLFAFL